MMTRRQVLTMAVLAAAAVGCGREVSAPRQADAPAWERVSLSNPTFALWAARDPGGMLSGEWTDELATGAAISVRITCMRVVGNQAWFGGIITRSERPDLMGLDAFTRVQSTGETSFSIVGTGTSCMDAPRVPLLPAHRTRIELK